MDGPYLVGDKLYTVDFKNRIWKSIYNEGDSIVVKVNNTDKDEFQLLKMEEISRKPCRYSMVRSIVAISDIEGNFNGLVSFLINNKIIDDDFNWKFGVGHLVLVGDFVDRGNQVTQVLWLIYKLEYQAKEQGGQVHFILANHE